MEDAFHLTVESGEQAVPLAAASSSLPQERLDLEAIRNEKRANETRCAEVARRVELMLEEIDSAAADLSHLTGLKNSGTLTKRVDEFFDAMLAVVAKPESRDTEIEIMDLIDGSKFGFGVLRMLVYHGAVELTRGDGEKFTRLRGSMTEEALQDVVTRINQAKSLLKDLCVKTRILESEKKHLVLELRQISTNEARAVEQEREEATMRKQEEKERLQKKGVKRKLELWEQPARAEAEHKARELQEWEKQRSLQRLRDAGDSRSNAIILSDDPLEGVEDAPVKDENELGRLKKTLKHGRQRRRQQRLERVECAKKGEPALLGPSDGESESDEQQTPAHATIPSYSPRVTSDLDSGSLPALPSSIQTLENSHQNNTPAASVGQTNRRSAPPVFFPQRSIPATSLPSLFNTRSIARVPTPPQKQRQIGSPADSAFYLRRPEIRRTPSAIAASPPAPVLRKDRRPRDPRRKPTDPRLR